MSSILHLLTLIYPIFTSVNPDPYSEYGSQSKKLMNKDLIWIRIHYTIWRFVMIDWYRYSLTYEKIKYTHKLYILHILVPVCCTYRRSDQNQIPQRSGLKSSIVDPDPYWILLRSFLDLDPDPYSEYWSAHANIG